MNDFAAAPMNVLLASSELTLLDVAARALGAQGDRVTSAMSIAEAIAAAEAERFDVALVDLTLDGDAGLALVHHLGAVSPGLLVHVFAPPAKVQLATQALALGAMGMHVAPVTGDELVQAVSDARLRLFEARRRAELEEELARMRRKSDLLDRLIRLARGSGQSEAMRVITDAFAQAADARGVALYAAFDAPSSECVRLASTGTARDMPQVARLDELAKTFELRKARPVMLRGSHGTVGLVALEGSAVDVEAEHGTLVELATVVLALVDSRRPRGPSMKDERGAVYTLAYFRDIAAREIEKARRHGRRVAVCAIELDAPEAPSSRAAPSERGGERTERAELEEVLRQVVRDTDVVASSPAGPASAGAPSPGAGEYFLLLPETGTLGAHACRRRIVLRAEGDRRARAGSVASDRRGPLSRRGPIAGIGVASFPHDGTSLDRIMRIARSRARAQTRSAVHALQLAALPLGEAVDTLLAKPILDSGPGSPAPLDLAIPAFLSLVAQACREARRGGAATLFVTVQPGMGVASAVRHAVRDANDVTVRAVDARGVDGCADLEAIVALAEHGTWVCCGRVTKERFRGVHASDPILADLVAHRLAQAGGIRGP